MAQSLKYLNAKQQAFFSNKTVLITGPTSGLGKCFAEILSRCQNIHLILCSRNTAKLQELSNSLSCTSRVFTCDLSNPDSRASLLNNLIENNIKVDVVINNAGIGYNKPFYSQSRTELFSTLEVNSVAILDFCHGLLKRNPKLHILNVSSVAGIFAVPNVSIYSSSKFFVNALTLCLHHELKNNGNHVTALCPGPLDTEFHNNNNNRITFPNSLFLRKPHNNAYRGLVGLINNTSVCVPDFLVKVAVLFSTMFLTRNLQSKITGYLYR